MIYNIVNTYLNKMNFNQFHEVTEQLRQKLFQEYLVLKKYYFMNFCVEIIISKTHKYI